MQAHFAAQMISVHTSKPVKGTDLYQGLKQQAEERREAESRRAVEAAKKALKGKTFQIHPKILKAIGKGSTEE